jgi:hypothetical protein
MATNCERYEMRILVTLAGVLLTVSPRRKKGVAAKFLLSFFRSALAPSTSMRYCSCSLNFKSVGLYFIRPVFI